MMSMGPIKKIESFLPLHLHSYHHDSINKKGVGEAKPLVSPIPPHPSSSMEARRKFKRERYNELIEEAYTKSMHNRCPSLTRTKEMSCRCPVPLADPDQCLVKTQRQVPQRKT
jgi:hypothetical protein